MPTVHLLIKGKVQGVFYRASAKEVADGLGITGWIKNTANGDVEAMASGNAEQVRQFIAWCERGPQKAIVEHVISTPQEEIAFNVFSVKRF
jgi:acylphosphatase